ALLARVREALGPTIVQTLFGGKAELSVITLDPSLEQLLRDSLKGAPDGMPSVEPTLADKLVTALADAARQQEIHGTPPVLLVAGPIRPWLARLTRYGVPNLKVLAYGEIPPDKSVRVAATVGGCRGEGMNIKRFVPSDMREAVRAVRAEL